MSGYVLPEDVADAINNNTTTIEGSKITTGSISANKINTTDLIVQSVKPLTGGGFEIDANGTAGELGNAHIYGARIYGTKLDGATITGSIIEASYMQNAIAFDTYTTYTSCPGFPNGIPILSSFTSVGTVTNSRPSYWSASSGDSFTITGTSDTFPYYGCLQNVKKLKTATTATTLALGGAPIIRSGFNIPTIVIPGFTNSVSLFTFNGVSAPPGGTLLGLSSVAPVNILGSLSMTISYRGNTYTKSLADFTSPLTSGYSFTGESSFAYIDYKTLQLTTNLYLYVKWQNAGGSLDSVGGGMLGGKQCSIGICTTSTPVHTSDTGISTVDLLSYSITGTVGTKPASYYGNYYVSITPQIPQISVVN